jgi:hypothetical protein
VEKGVQRKILRKTGLLARMGGFRWNCALLKGCSLVVVVKLDRVDSQGDLATAIASTLLLGLLVAETLAFDLLQIVVGLLAPAALQTTLK